MNKTMSLAGTITATILVLGGCANPTDTSAAQQEGSGDLLADIKKDETIAAKLPADNRQSGKVTVSINPDVEPVKFLDSDGNVTGLNPELLRAAGKVLGVEMEFQKGTFDAMVPGLESRRFDLVASIGDYQERQKKIDFIDYMKSGDGILASAKLEKPVSAPKDLCGLRIGHTRGTTQQGDLEAAAKACTDSGQQPVEVNAYQDAAAGVLSVQSGEADGFWGDLPAMLYNEKQKPDMFKVVHRAQDSIYGIGVSKDDTQLRDALRAALVKLETDGLYAALLKQWGQESAAMAGFPVNAGGPRGK